MRIEKWALRIKGEGLEKGQEEGEGTLRMGMRAD